MESLVRSSQELFWGSWAHRKQIGVDWSGEWEVRKSSLCVCSQSLDVTGEGEGN